MVESFGSISYNRPYANVTQSTELETEMRHSVTSEGKHRIELWATLNPGNTAEVRTVTVTLGTTADQYRVVVASGSVTKTYIREQVGGDTIATIAADLATLINTHPAVTARAVGGVVTVTGNIPGVTFTLANTGSTTPANVALAITTAASGIPLHRLMAALEAETVVKSTDQGAFLTQRVNGVVYDGAATPAVAKTWGPLEGSPMTKSLDVLQTEAGVARPAIA